ncbi:MAG: type I restriction enzyme HsdR N-terminal domain-containing protein [Edaphocola sp.]
MFSLEFEAYPFRFSEQNGRRYIFDVARNKYVTLTPEEWVRQHLLYYFRQSMNYPKGLTAVERHVKVNGLNLRYDIVVYDSRQNPWMLVECKEPDVPITEKTMHQLLRYYRVLQCPYWLLSNGATNYCAAVKDGNISWLHKLPAYDG